MTNNNNISVKQIKNNKYLFENNHDLSEIEVYLLDKPEYNSKKTLLLKTSDFEFIIEETFNERPYFLIKYSDKEIIIAERTLPVDGMINFRDMGGYVTKSNKVVKWGELYRSGHLHNASDEGLKYIDALNIKTIIDFRSSAELQKYPNPHYNDIKTYNIDPNAHAAELSAQFTSSKDNEDLNLVNEIIKQKENGNLISRYEIIMEQYENFVLKKESLGAFKEMVEVIGEFNAAPVLQHCRGGKDRTGFGALLILGILGVPKETIVYDYMLTQENRIQRNETKMKNYLKYTEDEDILNYLSSLIETRSEFIEASIDLIENKYGSIENFVNKQLGVEKKVIENIKSLYLYQE